MDTVNLVLTLLGTFFLTTIAFGILAARNWQRAKLAQRENARLVKQARSYAAGYDTGLVETSSPEPQQAAAK